jgi:hypothetical protein
VAHIRSTLACDRRMSTIARPSPLLSSSHWRLPLGFIAAIQILLPVLLLSIFPAVARVLHGWAGAAFFTGQLFCLSYTAAQLSIRLRSLPRFEIGLVALTIFLCLPAAIVSYLGLAGSLSFTNVLIGMGCVEIGLLTAARRSEVTSFAAPIGGAPRMSIGEWFLVTLPLLAFGIMAINSVRYTPADSDSMWYHLPLVAEIIKNHSIGPAQVIPLIAQGYPGAREAIVAWLTFPMTSDNLALLFLMEVPGVGLCMYGICREFGVPRRAALGVAGLFVSTPEISMWATSQKNDLFLTLAFLLTFFFILRWMRMATLPYALLTGLAGGLLCAAKIIGPVYAGALGVTCVAASFAGKRESSGQRSFADTLRAAAVMFGAAAIIGGPWYVRNLVYFHNPFFPKQISILGKTIFAGPLDAQFFQPITIGFHFLRLLSFWKQFVNELGVALPVLVAAPFLLLAVRSGRDKWVKDTDLAWLILLPELLFLTYLLQPYSLLSVGENVWEVQPRFLLCFLACLHISLGVLISIRSQYLRIGLPLMVLATMVNLARWSHFWWLVITLAALAAGLIPLLLKALRFTIVNTAPMKRHVAAILVLISLAGVAGCYAIDRFRERQKDDPEYGYKEISPGWGKVCSYVRHNIANERVLFLGRAESFPLYGPEFTNTLYAPEEDDVWPLIRKEHIKYVIGFRADERRGAHGETWVYEAAPTEQLIERNPDRFRLLYSAEGSEVLKVME